MTTPETVPLPLPKRLRRRNGEALIFEKVFLRRRKSEAKSFSLFFRSRLKVGPVSPSREKQTTNYVPVTSSSCSMRWQQRRWKAGRARCVEGLARSDACERIFRSSGGRPSKKKKKKLDPDHQERNETTQKPVKNCPPLYPHRKVSRHVCAS